MKTLTKIDRLSAWILLIGMVFYFISGYGITKGIINPQFAYLVHSKYLNVTVIIAFIFHAGFATRLALIRWRFWSWPVKSIWLIFFLSFLLGFLFVDRFYQINQNNNQVLSEVESKTIDTVQTTPTTDPAASTSDQKVFSKTDLAKYNGINGNPPYVAVNGKVYDMTEVFKNGSHYSHFAGTELTNAFYTRHAQSAISKYPQVGIYQP